MVEPGLVQRRILAAGRDGRIRAGDIEIVGYRGLSVEEILSSGREIVTERCCVGCLA